MNTQMILFGCIRRAISVEIAKQDGPLADSKMIFYQVSTF